MTLKVCHITTVHPVYDGRIFFKECLSLREAGFEVHLIAPNTSFHVREGIHIHGINIPSLRLLRFLLGNLRVLIKSIDIRAHLYHFHDPELIPSTLLLRLMGKKVIYDVHENLPAQIASKKYLGPLWMRKIWSISVAFTEALAAAFFSGVVTVIPEIASRFPKKKTIVIRNLPRISLIEQSVKSTDKLAESCPKKLVYAGGLSEIRGIKECIEALEILGDEEIRLVLIGRWSHENYYQTCRNLKGWKYVTHLGELPINEVYRHLQGAAVGLCLLYPEPNYIISLPVKAFEYMTLGIPMLMSDFPYWRKTFADCALFTNPLNPESIASGIHEMLEDQKKSQEMGIHGKTRVQKELSWEKEGKLLVEFYRRLLETKS